jgi:hypothetical protein
LYKGQVVQGVVLLLTLLLAAVAAQVVSQGVLAVMMAAPAGDTVVAREMAMIAVRGLDREAVSVSYMVAQVNHILLIQHHKIYNI